MAITLLATGGVLPQQVKTNSDLEKSVDTSDAWITKMTGIKKRYILADTESFIEHSYRAACIAIQQANIEMAGIGLIIMGTSTPEQIMPSSAVILQGLLGIKNCIAFDLQAACSGYIYSLINAYYIMQARPDIRYALILGCDAMSRIIDWQDRTTCVLFGDGFGATIIGRDSDPNRKGIFYSDLGATGSDQTYLQVPWGVGQGYAALERGIKPYMLMNGRDVFKSSVTYFTQSIKKALVENQLTANDVAWIIPHQANIRIIQAVAENLQVSLDKFVVTLDQHGNTSAASIPLALDELLRGAKARRGDLLLLAGFGAGYTWGVVLLEL